MNLFKNLALSTLILVVLLLTGGVAKTKANDTFRPSEININLAAGVSIATINARYGTTVIEQIPGTNLYRLQLPAGADIELIKTQMGVDPAIVFAELNYDYKMPEVRQISHAFTDQISHAFTDGQSPASFYGQPSAINLHLAAAQNFSRGWGVRVAVIDTGIDFAHPLFAGRVIYPNYDFVDNDALPTDELGGLSTGHGTFVAGLVALTAPQAGIMPIRAFGNDGAGTSFNVAKAIRFAVDNNAQIINMSFGLLSKDYLIRDAVDYAAQHNVVLVAAAGNDNNNKIHFPAAGQNVVAITSTDDSNVKAAFANYASNVTVCAPGVNLYSAYPGGKWAWWSGTSFSTPLVAGEAALLLALNPGANANSIEATISSAGINPDAFNPRYRGKLGNVRIDYLAAINQQIFGR